MWSWPTSILSLTLKAPLARTRTLLFIADVVGTPGMEALEAFLPGLIHEHSADACIVNGENAWEGKSLNQSLLQRMRKAGAQVITGGNHTWDRFQIHPLLKAEPGLLRPHNYPEGCSGSGVTSLLLPGGQPLVVINLQGRVYMQAIDCPFRCVEKELDRLDRESANRDRKPMVFIDMHAEATAEKRALAEFVDGRAAVVVGTHTHVQTADEQISAKGTAFITDAGMTGCHDSIIGLKTEVALKRFLYQTPHKYEEALGSARIQGVVVKVEEGSNRAVSIRRVSHPDFNRG